MKILEDWKIKVSVLWLFTEVAFLAHMMLFSFEPGAMEQIEGMQVGPEMLLIFAILFLVPLVMAFLSLTLKDSANRWANIILGIVFAGLDLFELVEVLAQPSAYSAYAALMIISTVVAPALIVWYAWKQKV